MGVCVWGGGGFSPKSRTVSLFFLAHNSRQKSVEFSPLAGHELQKEAGRGCRRTRMADQLQVSFVPPLTVHFGRRGGEEEGRGVVMPGRASRCLSRHHGQETRHLTVCQLLV